MFNTQIEPEKILEFCIQDGLPCYRIRWCDSWVPQASLSHSWQHLIENYWKSQAAQPTSDGGKYLPSVANRVFPNFASMLVDYNVPGAAHTMGHHHPAEYLALNAHHHSAPEQHTSNLSSYHHVSSHHNSNTTHHMTNSLHTVNASSGSTVVHPLGCQHLNTENPLAREQENTENLLARTRVSAESTMVKPNTGTENVTLPTNLPDFHVNSSEPAFDAFKSKTVATIKPPVNHRQVTAKKILSTAKTRVVRKVKQKSEIDLASKDGVTCSVCNRDFSRTAKPKKRLREHFRRIHLRNGKFKCSKCPKTFVCQQGLRDHEPVHSKERNHQCRYCQETFLRLSHLYVHLRTHEEERNFRCEACFKTFNVQSELKDHCTEEHSSITADLKCGVCKQNLYSATSVYSHSLRHAGTRDHKCELCGMAFKRKQILNQHKKRHQQDVSDRKTLQCSICEKVFATKSSLRDHMFLVHQTSLEKTDHKCEVCGKCFRNWANYHRHVMLHTKVSDEASAQKAKEQEADIRKNYDPNGTEKHTFVCNVCKTVEESVKSVLEHLQSHQVGTVSNPYDDKEVAAGEGNLSCTVCNKNFSKLKYLRGHMDIHSSIELKCDICGMVFKRRDTLRIHKKRHADRNETVENFRSRVGEIYNNRKELRDKIGKADEDGRVSCPYCQKLFNKRKLLLAHIVLHGNVLYSCEICGKSYKQRSCLNKHKKSHSVVQEKELITRRQKEANGTAGRKKYKCDVCNRSYAYKKRLYEHKKLHERESGSANESSAEETDSPPDVNNACKHQCDVCLKGFQRLESLSRHMNVVHAKFTKIIATNAEHTANEKNDIATSDKLMSLVDTSRALDARKTIYSCDTCSKSFTTKKELNSHKISHEKACTICNKVYQRKDALSRHVQQTHGVRLEETKRNEN